MIPLLLALACGQPQPPPPITPPEAPPVPTVEAPATAPPAPETEATPEASAAPLPSEADELHAAGLRARQAGDLPGAARHLREAVRRDEAHALARYDLAATLALLRRAGQTCTHDAFISDVMVHLGQAVELDEALRQRMRGDPDLADLRHKVRYLVLDGADLSKPADLARVLTTAQLVEPPQGAMGPAKQIRFASDGSLVITPIPRPVEVTPGEETVLTVERPVKGTWRVDARGLEVTLPDGAHRWNLTPTGVIAEGQRALWTDVPVECDA